MAFILEICCIVMNPQNNNQPSPVNTYPHPNLHIGISSHFVKGIFLVIAGALIGGIITYLIASSRFKSPVQTKTMTIKATGSVELKATEATISGYSNDYSKKYTTLVEAENVAKQTAEKAKAEMVKLGVSTTAISISTYATPDYKYEYAPTPAPSEGGVSIPSYPSSTTTGYYPSISVSVTLKSDTLNQADQILKILDTYKLYPTASYYATPSDKTKSEARKNALLDAKSQVEELEDIGNVHVKRIISVKDASAQSTYQDPYYPQATKIYLDQGSTSVPYQVALDIVYQLR